MEQKLTKEQTRVFLVLNEAIGQARNMLVRAEKDMDAQVELLRSYFKFGDEPIDFKPVGEVLVMVSKEAKKVEDETPRT